jgi:hypothetical protein
MISNRGVPMRPNHTPHDADLTFGPNTKLTLLWYDTDTTEVYSDYARPT